MRKFFGLLMGMTLGLSLHGQKGIDAMDVHTHMISDDFIKALTKYDALLDEGFPLPSWSAEEHIKMMEESGISRSIISMPAPHPWRGNVMETRAIVRRFNDNCAELKRQYPSRFDFVATLPLPDVQAATEEAIHALDTLGSVGIKLATNIDGQYLGDAALEPLMETLNARSVVVIIHPHRPTPVNGKLMKAIPLAIYEYPAETTRAVVNMIANGVTSRYPNIKWVVPHCASFLPLALARMQGVHPIMERAGLMPPIDWSTATSNLYYDLAGNLTSDVLASMLTITTPDRLLYGSDYPYVNDIGVKKNREHIVSILSQNLQTRDHIEAIMKGNALKLFAPRL